MTILKYNFLCLFKNKALLFWTLVFPIVLGLLFKIAFSDIEKGGNLKTINIAIIDRVEIPNGFLDSIENAKYNEDLPIFDYQLVDKDTAFTLLENGEVSGVIDIKSTDNISLSVTSGGYSQTIIKSYLDQYMQINSSISSLIILSHGNLSVEEVIAKLNNQKDYLKDAQTNTKKTSMVSYYFFTLIGMAILYGSFWGSFIVDRLLPNNGNQGIRLSISPVKRKNLLIAGLFSSFVVHFIELIIIILVLDFGYGVSFNTNYLYLIITCALGSSLGISYGAFISMVLKRKPEGTKVAVTIITSMAGSFLAGMMVISVKYFVQTNIPILQYINPVNVITDALYSLSYYTDINRYLMNIGILALMTIIFLTSTAFLFRRDSYESI